MPAAGRAADDIRAAIEAAGGAIPFSRFMALALYGPNGFYTAPAAGRVGRRGDFLTSPEVGPLFGAVVARFLDAEWDRLDRPEVFTVVDAGAGPGTLARAVLAARPACSAALHYVAVEVSEEQRGLHPADVESSSPCPPGDRRCRARQRTARQSAVPARRPRRWVAGGVRDERAGRHVRRGPVGPVRPDPVVPPAPGAARRPGPTPGRGGRVARRGQGDRPTGDGSW